MMAQEVHYTKNLVDVLLGWHCRLVKAIKGDQTLHLENGKVQELIDEIVEGLVVYVHRWSTVASCITGMKDTNRNGVMADCWLHWQAVQVCTSTTIKSMLVLVVMVIACMWEGRCGW